MRELTESESALTTGGNPWAFGCGFYVWGGLMTAEFGPPAWIYFGLKAAVTCGMWAATFEA